MPDALIVPAILSPVIVFAVAFLLWCQWQERRDWKPPTGHAAPEKRQMSAELEAAIAQANPGLYAELKAGREQMKAQQSLDALADAAIMATLAEEPGLRVEFLTHCRPATVPEYNAWLAGYHRAGNGANIAYDYSLRRYECYVLERAPGTVPTLHGANSVEVIVPAGTGFTPDDIPGAPHRVRGHIRFYFMVGFQAVTA